MDPQDRKRIQFYYTELVDNVRASEVCDFLFEHEVITDEELEEITKFQMTTKERVRTLLRILMNNSKRSVLSIFCQSLRFCDNDVSRHLSDQLESGDISALLATGEKLKYDFLPEVIITKATEMKILEPIGQGGFGTVYRAVHEVYGLVAYKKLQTIGFDNVMRELLHEANMQRLNHPNIVRLVAVTCELEHYGLLLDYMMYGDLECFLSEYQVKIAWKIHIIYDVTLGINYLHNLKPPIIHGDLKVQNVLIGDGFRAKITDFGLARWKMYSTIKKSASLLKGTITHVPPERFRNVNLPRTLKTDVYSFGILLWEILSQKKPFDQNLEHSLIRLAVIEGQRPNMADVENVEATPKCIKDMIADCWDNNPDHRPLFGQVKLSLEMILKDTQESILSARDDLFHEELHKFSEKKISETYRLRSQNVQREMKQLPQTTNADSRSDHENIDRRHNVPIPDSVYQKMLSQHVTAEEVGYQALFPQQNRTKPDGECDEFMRRQHNSYCPTNNDNVSPVKMRPKCLCLNILLLGETGVGKSTWINGFANYIKYQTFDEAVIGEELAPIRCKFQILSQYDEYEVFTGYDENECYDNVGESCTQLPMTYVFTEENFTIQLIDTPGIGDTRGIEQDKENMQLVLDHISNFPKIHGICILLKSNVTRLTVQFKYCIKRLLTQLHRDACQNVVFCFTNCRGSQYGPGGTFSALKELLKENKDVNIKPYFCIDNEAMQYLYATKHCNEFKPDESHKSVCVDSWNRAVVEIEQLIMHIANLKPHDVQNTSSLNDARRNIFKLAIPLEQLNKEINDNILAIEKEQQKMDEIQDATPILLKELITPIIRIDCTPLDIPKIVCRKCVQEIKTSNVTTLIYHCSENFQSGFWRKKLQNANNICAECKCSRADHHQISYISRKIEEFVVNRDMNDIITNKTALRAEINAHKIDLQTKLKEYKQEQNEIQLAHKKFAYFLKLNSIAPYNENLLDYFEHFTNTQLPNTNDLSQIEDKRLRYKMMSTIIDKAISEDFGDVTPPSANDVKKLISDLGQLKHFGNQLTQLLCVINTTQDPYDVRIVDISSPGVANNILKRVSQCFAH